MISTNFWLLRSAKLSRSEEKSLLVIFSSSYLEMYDLALFVGYAIYLATVLLSPLELYHALLAFSSLLLCTQLFKLFGVIAFYKFLPNLKQNTIWASAIVGMCYLLLAIMPSYQTIGIWAFWWFAALRLVQGLAFGFEIGFTLLYSNTQISARSKGFVYLFILLACELGAFVGILFNRLLMHRGMQIAEFNEFVRLQYLIAGGVMLFNLKFWLPQKKLSMKTIHFARMSFFYTLTKNWRDIILRAQIIALQVILIMMVIFRIPSYLHLALGLSYIEINLRLMQITLLGFCGSLGAKTLARLFNVQHLMLGCFIATIAANLLSIATNASTNFYIVWLLSVAFLYGAFLRLSGLVLLSIKDFSPHNRLTGRYLSYIIAYTIFGSLAIFTLDVVLNFTHNVHAYTPEYILIVAAIGGGITLHHYPKRFSSSSH